MAFANGNGFIVEVLALGQTGRAGIVWRDAWGGATAYVANDGVFYLGSSYRCVVANINVVPTNAAFWAPIAVGDRQVTISSAQPSGTAPEGSLWFVV